MKKLAIYCGGIMLFALTSCTANKWSATQVPANNYLTTSTAADLQVGNKVTYNYRTNAKDRKGGVENCKKAAITAMLRENGNADVIVAPEFFYDTTLKFVRVTGRPATYTNFRNVVPEPTFVLP